MLNRFQAWRERGWTPVEAEVYAQAWQRFGGSVATHPQVVERLAGLAQIPVRYLGWEQDERAWYRVIYLAKIGNRIYILHCFEKKSAKTGRSDSALAKARLKQVLARLRSKNES